MGRGVGRGPRPSYDDDGRGRTGRGRRGKGEGLTASRTGAAVPGAFLGHYTRSNDSPARQNVAGNRSEDERRLRTDETQESMHPNRRRNPPGLSIGDAKP